ncbi:MAG TPA: membrane protein insertion efficiency factor YidD [Dehalococcoidia bacterium]|nr:membrane protein insertion efficiency factor YidD [Dehalococcoidia bacterium]
MKRLALKLIKLYQGTISQVSPPSCRYRPTCSQYGYEAISKYGLWRGGWMTVWRLIRCNPFSKGGYDPVS